MNHFFTFNSRVQLSHRADDDGVNHRHAGTALLVQGGYYYHAMQRLMAEHGDEADCGGYRPRGAIVSDLVSAQRGFGAAGLSKRQ